MVQSSHSTLTSQGKQTRQQWLIKYLKTYDMMAFRLTDEQINELFEETSQCGSFHDAMYEAFHRQFTVEELKDLFNQLPLNMQLTAVEWGLGDTVFRDEAYAYFIRKNV